jgi:3-oxoadipate enol-lactonase
MGLYFEQWRKTLMTLFGPIPVSRFGISQQLLYLNFWVSRHGRIYSMIRKLLCVMSLLMCAEAGAQTFPSSAPAGNFLDVGGVKLWYEECKATNSSPAGVVLLHDGLVHSVTWDGVWAPLCAKYHVVRYDRRGYGRSEPSKDPFVPEDDLYKVMRKVHLDHAIIVGNSSGGGLALDFALAHPEMTEALFLIGPVVHGMASSDYFNARGSQNSAPLAHGDLQATARNWSKDRFLIAGDDPRARKQLYDALVQNPQNLKVAGELEMRPSPPTVMRLSQVRVPTLVVVGDADIADVFAYSGAIEGAVPLASLEVWKDAGHLIQIQRPAELVARFNRFVCLVERPEIALTDRQLGIYVGRYKLFNRAGTLTLKDRHLVLEFPGDPYYWLFAASETRFFLRTDETEIEFQKDAGGKVVEMVIHNSDGSVVGCPRIMSE